MQENSKIFFIKQEGITYDATRILLAVFTNIERIPYRPLHSIAYSDGTRNSYKL